MYYKMNNTTAFYKLALRRRTFEEAISKYDLEIKEVREQAKKEPKGSQLRKDLMEHAQEITDCKEYQILKAEMNCMNFCINTVF